MFVTMQLLVTNLNFQQAGSQNGVLKPKRFLRFILL